MGGRALRITILGAGALGTFLGAVLGTVHEVTLVSRNREHVIIARDRGVRVEGRTELTTRVHAVTSAADAPPADLYVVTTKAYDTRVIAAEAANGMPDGATVLTLQNGLGNVAVLEEMLPNAVILGGATSHGVTFVEPGVVRHAGDGFLRVGSPQGDETAADRAAGVFVGAGLACDVTDDLESELWAKVVVNVGINPATAITGLPNGALLKIPELAALMARASAEAADVARAIGVQLPLDDLVARTRWVAEHTATNKSSMLQDIERGRRTEIDALSGVVVRAAADAGVDAPVNATLVALVKGIEASTRF